MTQTELKNGQTFEFDNEQWCERMQNDDLRSGWAHFDKRMGWFCIFFNAKCIHTSKTFKSFENRLNKLFFDWNLEFNTSEG